MSQPDATRRVAQTWEAVSPAWERHRDHVFAQTRPVSEWLAERVAPEPGQTVLELGAGPGDTGFLVAGALGSDGRLISTDVSPGMVDVARRASAARGLTNVEHRVMDAQQLELGDGAVDGVVSRFALMLVPDPGRVFGEICRVLRPGGRVAYAVWGAIDRNPWVTVIVGALLQNGHAPPTSGGPDASPFAPGGLFSLAAPEANTGMLDAAGLTDVTVEECTGAMHFDTFDQYWDIQTSLAGPLTQLLASLTSEQIDAVRASARAATEPFGADDGLRLPYTATTVAATAPG